MSLFSDILHSRYFWTNPCIMANIPLSLRSCCQNSDTIYHFFSSPSTTYNFSFAFPPLLQLLPNIHSCDFLISSSCCHFLIMSSFFSFAPISEPACPSSIRIIILSQVPLLILLFLLFSIFPQSILHPLDISSFPPFDFTFPLTLFPPL